jgi:uncharacterized protein (TIGR02145 family)
MKKFILLFVMIPALSFAQGEEADILLNGTVSAENNQIKNVEDPTDDQDAVTLVFLLEKLSYLQDQIDALQSTGNITDLDGNTYNIIPYCDQVWTVQNAQMSTYRDGTPIPEVSDNAEWANLTTGAWKYTTHSIGNSTPEKLYNWYAVMGIHDEDPNTPNKEFAPEGWHVPSDAEWTTFENCLTANGYNYDGTTTVEKIAKAIASTSGWANSDIEGTPGYNQSTNNSSGFNIYPFGTITPEGVPVNGASNSVLWSSTDITTETARRRFLYFGSQDYVISSAENKKNGFSVRLVKD